jgi:hypothetical protein
MRFLEATRRVKDGQSRLEPVFPPVTLPEPVREAEPPPPPPEIRVESVSLGLRTELGMWGVRNLAWSPFLYRLGRAFYRVVVRPLR